ncbi:MAG: hypothetical protein WEB58_11440 [Planctomycetaceae bacterium]
MPTDGEKSPLNPTALAVRDAARLLSKVGAFAVTEAMLHDDVEAGAPTNADGTINLVHYAAWLVKQMGRSSGDPHGD